MRSLPEILNVFRYLSGLNAGRADADALGHAAHQGAHLLEIWIPAAISDVVSVADIMPKLGLFTTNFALTGHGNLVDSGYGSAKGK